MSTSFMTNPQWWRRAAMALTMLALGVVVLTVHAQAPQTNPPGPPASAMPLASAGDPPSRVARLSDASGQVWLSSLDAPEWITADRNRPLTNGDRLAVDKGGKAELTLGSTTLRLDEGTELEVAQLDDTRFAVQLFTGSVAARFRNPQSLAEFELDTDEGRFRVLQAGRYRFDRDTRSSDVTVYGGQAIFEGRNSALPVSAGQHIEFWLDAAGAAQYNTVPAERDAFASWNDERDRSEDRYASAPNRYVSPEMTGAQDLERYGAWQQDPDYGSVWIPRGVPADWAPYSTGHWASVQPWGWTWIDDAPWGFAPFHYGRWVNRRNVWCWTPGTYVARPVYAPALVAWVGGPRGSVSLSIGGGRNDVPVGWFPLGPREVFVPSYRHSPIYVRNINIVHVTNVVNITNIVENRGGAADRRQFVNRESPHALTVVPANVVMNREPVHANASRFGDSPAMRALKDQRASPVSALAPLAAPATPPPRGNNIGDVRQRPPGFAATPRGDRVERADRGGDPRNDRGGFNPRAAVPAPNAQVNAPMGNGQPGNGQPGNGQSRNGQAVNAQLGNGQPSNGQPGNGQPSNVAGQSGRGQPPGARERVDERPPRPNAAPVITAPTNANPTNASPLNARPINASPTNVSPPTPPGVRSEPIRESSPQGTPAANLPPPRERFRRPATPSEGMPPPNPQPVAPSANPAPSPQAPVQGQRPAQPSPTPSAQLPARPQVQPQAPVQPAAIAPPSVPAPDPRAAARAERGERRERGELGQAPSVQRGPEHVRAAPVLAPTPAPMAPVRAAPAVPAVRPEAPRAETPRAEPTPREERRDEKRDPAR